MTRVFFETVAIGFAIAAPVGPIGILCIRRTLAGGIWHGIASGLGAATADGCYGSIIAFGLTALSTMLLDAGSILNVVGGLFLLYIGIKTMLTPVETDASDTTGISSNSLLVDYGSTFALTITNPLTILAFIGIFAGLGETAAGQSTAPLIIVLGVFTGSTLWWLLLSSGVSLLRSRITPGMMLWVNRVSGVVISLFALRILLGLFR